MKYPDDFIARVKAVYKAQTIHNLCDEHSPFLGAVLCDMQGDKIAPETILHCDDLSILKAIARHELERTAVWLEWQETDIAKLYGYGKAQ